MRLGKFEASKLLRLYGYSSINRIIKRLRSNDLFKRKKALDELGEIGNEHPEVASEFLKLIIDSFLDPAVEVRLSAISAFGKIAIREPKYIKEGFVPLLHRIRDKSAEVRVNTIEVVGKITEMNKKHIKKATPYLVARLNDSDKRVVQATINSLNIVGNISPEVVVPFLIKQLKHKKSEVRIAVAEIIKNIAKNNIEETKIAIPTLFETLKDTNQWVRNMANEALIEIGIRKPRYVMPSYIQCLEDKEREVLWWITALSAIKAIGKIAEKRQKETIGAVPFLAKCLTKDIWELRENASVTLGKIGKNKLDYVLEAIPNLVNCLKDPDDLVRTATAHALDKIGVRQKEYRLIQKASEAISSSEFVVKSIRNFGISAEKAQKILFQAKTAFEEHSYEEAIELGRIAEEEARKQEEFFRKVTDNLEITISFIEEIESYGINVSEPKKLLPSVKKFIDMAEYSKALEIIEEAKSLAKEIKDRAKPELLINVTAYEDFKAGEWSRVAVTIQNDGETDANNLEIDFFGPIESRGSRRIPILKIGEKSELLIDLSPRTKGEIPIEINVSYQDFAKRGYQLSDKCIITTINNEEEIKSMKKTLFNIQTHIPQNYSISEKESIDDLEIICQNCGAKMPKNFRVCGKCGTVLQKTCPNCGNNIPTNFKFCGSCGAKIGNVCPKCKSENPQNFMFCGNCGAKLK